MTSDPRNPGAVASAPAATAAVAPARERILVIDDEENIRSTLEEFLAMNGYRVDTAATGKEGLDLLGHQAFDLVLSDLRLPDMDGLAVIEWLRETQPALPVLVMTGHATVESTIRALRLGAYDYLQKPFRLDEIERTIENCLDRQRLQRRNTELTEMNARLQEIERIKDDLLATVSHEFRTPLTGIRGFLGILQSMDTSNLRPDQQHSLSAIAENVRRLDEMIANLLALVESQDSAAPPIREPVVLAALVREVLDSQDPVRGRGTLEVDISTEAEIAEVLVDRRRFPLVLSNLLDNAFKFARTPGEARVRLAVRCENSQAIVEVHDAGIGIPRGLGDALFDRFTQADMSSTREYQGAGLGLAVVREIVGAHGGKAELADPVLGGASLRVTVPVVDLARRA